MTRTIAIVVAILVAGALPALAQNKAQADSGKIAELQAQVSGLRADMAKLQQSYEHHYHTYNPTGVASATDIGARHTSGPAT